MGSLMQELKRQASFFLRQKIKTARLALTDVTPAQLLTEEVIYGDSMAADIHAITLISRAAFEVDDYDRIVHILHLRLSKFDEVNWRGSYKALVLLEHLLTHGPHRIAEEFESDQDIIRDMANFSYVDEKGFDWGLSVKKKAERVIELLEDRAYLKEERARARKLTFGIKGFGSFSHNGSSNNDTNARTVLRSNSLLFGDHHHHHDIEVEGNLLASDEYSNLLATNKKMADDNLKGWSHTYRSHGYAMEEDHPFWDKEHQTRVSLLSSV
ncbi:ENTH domain-containing protein C794.11c [Sesamum indicum]|uniref:ENTH domain-containing protein C794.11c n=1 Tax=Sesamum indicum TaxID=4182 RepID=A0A6I9TWB5_SESIN|nr:ENTH domain-containing protein C794.11c [Sesamum indicum]